ncbi:hypothetical protein LZ32DRAFT_2480 [Colletotrichum eremochloae]|nr:hypothetical protein LZ32DRAFT_2480 [Colletotrichum eremochloae]
MIPLLCFSNFVAIIVHLCDLKETPGLSISTSSFGLRDPIFHSLPRCLLLLVGIGFGQPRLAPCPPSTYGTSYNRSVSFVLPALLPPSHPIEAPFFFLGPTGTLPWCLRCC